MPLLALALLCDPVAADVYRCERDGAVVFSDVPCGPDASVHESRASLSVVAPSADLAQVQARNRSFVETRRAALEAARARAARRRDLPVPPQRAEQDRTWPVWPGLPNRFYGPDPTVDPRTRAQRQNGSEDPDRPSRRELLPSRRDGGNRPQIIRRR